MYVGLEVQLHGLPDGNVSEVRWRAARALNREFDPDDASDIMVDIAESAGGDRYAGRAVFNGGRRGVVLVECFSEQKMVGLWVDVGSGKAELWENGDYVFEPFTAPT